MLRDPEYRAEFIDKDWNMLADFVEGKLKNKAGRRAKGQAFEYVSRKNTPEHAAVLSVQLEMQSRRAKYVKTWGVLPQLIDEASARHGADPVRVAAIIKKGRR